MATITRMTLDQFLAIPGFDEKRLELIDGEVWEKPMPTWGHGTIAGELYVACRPFGYGSVEPRAIIPATGSLDASSPIPDFSFYVEGPPAVDEWMRNPPEIVAEILSPGQSRRDMRAKVDLYISFGVPTVWVFDPDRKTVDVYEEGERQVLEESGELRPRAVPGLAISIRELFTPQRRP